MEAEKTYTAEEARNLKPEDRKKGLRVAGNQPPFGGRWMKEGDELVLAESPTEDGGPRKAEEEKK